MKKQIAAILFLFLSSIAAIGQSTTIAKVNLSPAEISAIVKKFTQNERLFRQAFNVYAFNRSVIVQTIGMGGQVSGEFRRDAVLSFNDAGERFERVLFAPVSTLTEITITPADIENFGGLDPFAIEPKNIDRYNFDLVGKEKIDELDLYVFNVTPKVLPDPKKSTEKLFSGRIWIDDQDLLIVKSKGKAVPEGKNERFPVMETYRENIDGKYWFPSYTAADDELVFDSGQVVKIRVRLKYTNYRLGRSDVQIIAEEDVPAEKPTPTPTPKKP